MVDLIIKNAQLVNEGKIVAADVLIRNQRIERIDATIDVKYKVEETDAGGLHMIPGIIDDQVHFREPGLTHKANIYTEAKAAVAGGTTSFMEMPNVNPLTLTSELLEAKFEIARNNSLANYSFFIGAGHHNIDELRKVDKTKVCGIKIFMGSSTGDMLVDEPQVLEKIFSERNDMLIATHCEDDKLVKERTEMYLQKYGEQIPFHCHPEIRNEQVCLNSSSFAVSLAKKYNSRLHILHISTADELSLFTNAIPLKEKRITSEVCVHHLWFDKNDYERLGSKIKCNPAIKEAHHKKALFEALLDNRLDIIATDHAPHTMEEKNNFYSKAPAGLPLVQHSLNVMLEFYHQGKISLERIVEKMCHAPAECFEVSQRGFLREGYFADAAIVDVNHSWVVKPENILYKCGWSPFEKYEFSGRVLKTFVNGNLVWDNGVFHEMVKGERLTFNRN
ncbi:MAG: dihydroorotase [Chitinophagales bacterium]|nr:dihydroorotase [Chitinophagales bacterium]